MQSGDKPPRGAGQAPAAPTGTSRSGAAETSAGEGARQLSGIALPAVALPRGGGAIRGIGEKFSTNPATGTGSLSIPIATSPGRAGFELGLQLSYDSGAGNGPFGVGWSLSIPSISRKTDKGLPRYEAAEDPDVFVLSGAEDLVPSRGADGSETPDDVLDRGDFRVRRYRPRTEGLFARIERWTHRQTGDSHWRTITRDNVLSIYGRDKNARIADPDCPERVFSWLLEETRDDRGNVARYTYRAEDGDGVDPGKASESNRFRVDASGARVLTASAQRYPARIQYGNRVPVLDRSQPVPASDDDYLFDIVFDHGEYAAPDDPEATEAPEPARASSWPVRPDPFSSYRAGFEVRTYRLCRRILMLHRFAELGPAPCLVRSTDFTYKEGPAVTYLTAVRLAGYVRERDEAGRLRDTYARLTLPPIELGYQEARVVDELRTIDRDALEGIPAGVEASGGQWVDLDGEGIPGVLIPHGRGWYYKSNLGDGRLAPPALLRSLPSPAELGGGAQQLTDLGGDGNLDLVQVAPPLAGYFERTPDGAWAPFVAFQTLPSIDWNDPNLRFLDLDGDGLPDILITASDAFVWVRSRGKQGLGPAALVTRPADELRGPAVVFADGTETIHLADMSGDGLTDIVRVRNGEVCYWPNLGYGRFGPKVTLDRSPLFDLPDGFDPARVRFADIDGSGTADIVYLGRDGVRLYVNQSGNALSEPARLESLPPVDSLSDLSVVDLLGQGTACLVWSAGLSGSQARPIAYVDLMGGKKPHVLDRIVNNLGAETRIAYAPSTRFYLRDKAEGRPWLTRLPFPVHVIERIERHDHVARSKLVTTFRYHHGYFDGDEREFRGFACVEQWDAETFAGSGLFPELPYDVDPAAEGLSLPPVRTVTWFHTGAWLDRERLELALAREYYAGDPQAPLLPDTTLPADLSIREQREAARALRGQVLRQEIYAEDGAPESAHPYTVSERDHEVVRVQPAAPRAHAVFFVHPRHTLTLQYERRPDDPRTMHEVVLEVDRFGNVTRSAAIAYPRRAPLEPEQERLWATITERRLAHLPDGPDAYRVSVPVETVTKEITGLTRPPNGLFSMDDIAAQVAAAAHVDYEDRGAAPGPVLRTIEHEQQVYYRDYPDLAGYRQDPRGPLPLGETTERALLHHTRRLALTPGLVTRFYGDHFADATELDAALRDECGYLDVRHAGRVSWWARSGRAVFDPSRFFLPVESADPFGGWTAVDYDAHALLVVAARAPRVPGEAFSGQVDTTDPDQRFGSLTSVTNDYRILGPAVVADPNGARSRVEVDALGMVTKVWQLGREGANEGDPPDLPGVEIFYDLHARRQGRGPAWVHVASREAHGAGGQPFDAAGEPNRAGWQHARTYSDGSGREAMKIVQAEPGPAPELDAAGRVAGTRHEEDRWACTGRTVFDNKGNPVKKYEPFFSGKLAYEDEEALVASGVTVILRYDPLGRLVRTDQPNGTHTCVIFDAWKQETWDENDTVLSSLWYSERGRPDPAQPAPPADDDTRAAWLAARHASTPTVTHLDALGRPFLSVAHNRRHVDGAPVDDFQETRIELDVEGNQLAITDARQVRTLEQEYDVLGRAIESRSADAGRSRVLLDVAEQPVFAWDPRGIAVRRRYDALRRPTHLFVKGGAEPERLAERVLYGEAHPDAAACNLRTRSHRSYDGAGVLIAERFDFNGNLLASTRRLAKDFRGSPDWTPLADLDDAAEIAAGAGALLETEEFTTTDTFDALDRLTSRATADDSVTRLSYNQAGLLERVDARIRGAGPWRSFVEDIDYNARGQRTLVEHGNDTSTELGYDDRTFRLIRQVTRRGDGTILQHLSYTHDPVGNIVAIRDAVSYGNADVRADGLYEYDALYQIVRAEGREHPGQQPAHEDAAELGLPRRAHANDWQKLRRYSETYTYDRVGNITAMTHAPLGPGAGGWTRRYDHALDSNRLRGTSAPGDAEGTFSAKYEHDAAGNMIRMPHLPVMEWDHANRLLRASRKGPTDLGPPDMVNFAYDAAGQRARKVYEHSGVIEERSIRPTNGILTSASAAATCSPRDTAGGADGDAICVGEAGGALEAQRPERGGVRRSSRIQGTATVLVELEAGDVGREHASVGRG